MEASEFAAAKQRVMSESLPSDGNDLDGMALDFDAYLWHSPLISQVVVRLTGDTSHLITAECQATPRCSVTEIAEELERIWLRDLRYRYFEAHTVATNERGVRLDAVTQIAEGGFFVTAAVVADTVQPDGDGSIR
ncbi:hypothetical protein [Microbispora sp. GKU 823]|uniref:hypothetical protein n=1 Tax=Microbispora sp. GKU 823 TaxID=1652100 RepID=UPI0009A36670|nr:hypothetical protein [Microbispora sp. GKU 823]OPG11923.1 hypothetical protein B1L11_17080 [Microbispora sp. GKU 823]